MKGEPTTSPVDFGQGFASTGTGSAGSRLPAWISAAAVNTLIAGNLSSLSAHMGQGDNYVAGSSGRDYVASGSGDDAFMGRWRTTS